MTLPRRHLEPNGHRWVRVVHPTWADPLDTSHAQRKGGRWNPPNSWHTLYLNRDLLTARAQVARLLAGTMVEPADLTDDAFELVAVLLPDDLAGLDVVTEAGLRALHLPVSYPIDADGREVSLQRCQNLAVLAHGDGLHGVESRSVATPDGTGREFAWWPTGQGARLTGGRVAYGRWRSHDVADEAALFDHPVADGPE